METGSLMSTKDCRATAERDLPTARFHSTLTDIFGWGSFSVRKRAVSELMLAFKSRMF